MALNGGSEQSIQKRGREMLGGITVQEWNQRTGGGAFCPLSWMDEQLPSPCPLCGATRESDDHDELPGPALAEAETPQDLGFTWQVEAGNYVRDVPADLGRAYIEGADAPWDGDQGEPGLTDGPVRLIFLVLGQEDATGEWEEIEIASLRFATLKDALAAWEAR